MPLRSRGVGIEAIERLRRFDERRRARGVDPVGVDHAAVMTGADGDEPPGEVEAIADFVEQPDEVAAPTLPNPTSASASSGCVTASGADERHAADDLGERSARAAR